MNCPYDLEIRRIYASPHLKSRTNRRISSSVNKVPLFIPGHFSAERSHAILLFRFAGQNGHALHCAGRAAYILHRVPFSRNTQSPPGCSISARFPSSVRVYESRKDFSSIESTDAISRARRALTQTMPGSPRQHRPHPTHSKASPFPNHTDFLGIIRLYFEPMERARFLS